MKCKREDCKHESNNPKDFDDDGYCMPCSDLKDELQRGAAN